MSKTTYFVIHNHELLDEEAKKKEYAVICDQCEGLTINGVTTHEHGCPNQESKRALPILD